MTRFSFGPHSYRIMDTSVEVYNFIVDIQEALPRDAQLYTYINFNDFSYNIETEGTPSLTVDNSGQILRMHGQTIARNTAAFYTNIWLYPHNIIAADESQLPSSSEGDANAFGDYFDFGILHLFEMKHRDFKRKFDDIIDTMGWGYEYRSGSSICEHWLEFTARSPFSIQYHQSNHELYLEGEIVASFDTIREKLTTDLDALNRAWDVYSQRQRPTGYTYPERTRSPQSETFSFGRGSTRDPAVDSFIHDLSIYMLQTHDFVLYKRRRNNRSYFLNVTDPLSVDTSSSTNRLMLNGVCIATLNPWSQELTLHPENLPPQYFHFGPQSNFEGDNAEFKTAFDELLHHQRWLYTRSTEADAQEEHWLFDVRGTPFELTVDKATRMQQIWLENELIASFDPHSQRLTIGPTPLMQAWGAYQQQVEHEANHPDSPENRWQADDDIPRPTAATTTMTASLVLQMIAGVSLVAVGLVLMTAGIIGLAGMPILGITGPAAIGALAGGFAATCIGVALLKSDGIFGGSGGSNGGPSGFEPGLLSPR